MVCCLAYQRHRLLNYSVCKVQQQDLFLASESFLTLHRRFMSCTSCRFLCVLTIRQLITYLSDVISIKSNSLYQYNLRSTGKLLLDYPKGKMLTTLRQNHFQQQLPVRNLGMAYQCSFVKQHYLTVLNLYLKPIFLRSIFIVYNLLTIYFIVMVMYFCFLLNT